MNDRTCSKCGAKMERIGDFGIMYCSHCYINDISQSGRGMRTFHDYYDSSPKFVMPLGTQGYIFNPDAALPMPPKPEPPKPTREQLMRDLSAAIKRTYEQLEESGIAEMRRCTGASAIQSA